MAVQKSQKSKNKRIYKKNAFKNVFLKKVNVNINGGYNYNYTKINFLKKVFKWEI